MRGEAAKAPLSPRSMRGRLENTHGLLCSAPGFAFHKLRYYFEKLPQDAQTSQPISATTSMVSATTCGR